MNYLFYLLLASPSFALRDIIYKNGYCLNIDSTIITALWLIISGFLSLIYLFFKYNNNNNIFNDLNYKIGFNLLFISILTIIGYLSYFKALKRCKNIEIIRTIFSGLIILCVMFFSIYKNNYLEIHQYFGILFVLIGIFLVYNKNINIKKLLMLNNKIDY